MDGGQRGRQEQAARNKASSSTEPSLGSCYNIQMCDESWHVAEIVQKRENSETTRIEYYVHYRECELANDTCTVLHLFCLSQSQDG